MEKVLLEKRGQVAYVTINRPERLNACDSETYATLASTWEALQDDNNIRVSILTGTGERAFCAGSDIRVAAEHAQFGLGEVLLGLLPGGGGTQRLPRLIPLGRALEMLLTGTRIDAAEALRLGLVDHVVPATRLLEKCDEIAQAICRAAPLAVEKIRQAVLEGRDQPLADGLKLEAELFDFLRNTEDSKEGAQAFAEKRTPNWQER